MTSDPRVSDRTPERSKFLYEFRQLNPYLAEGRVRRRCRSFWDLLTASHRESPDCCDHDGSGLDLDSRFLVHPEQWRDSHTGLPVIVAHPGCGYGEEDDDHGPFRDFFASRGLGYLVSTRSWHGEDARLVVIGRVDVLESIRLPSDEDSPVESVHPGPVGIDWEMREVIRLAEEGLIRDRGARLAEEADDDGNYQEALGTYCRVAYGDRTGGFHRLAREQLGRAKKFLAARPGLDTSSLRFKNSRDREFVCGSVSVLLSRSSLQRRLGDVELPLGWKKFVSYESGFAFSRFTAGGRTGTVTVSQGREGALWSSSLDVDPDGVYRTSLDGDLLDGLESANYCWADPEAAAEAAIAVLETFEGNEAGD